MGEPSKDLLIEKVELTGVSFPSGLHSFESGRVINPYAVCNVIVTRSDGTRTRREIIVTRARGLQAQRAGSLR